MSWITKLGGRLPDFEDVLRRFPVPVAIMAVFTIWIIAENHFNLRFHQHEVYVYLGFILAGYASVIAAFCVEARKGTSQLGAVIGVALAAPAFLLSYFSLKLDFTVAMGIGAAILFLGNAAAWKMGREDRNVWNFTQKLWTGALFAAVGSVIFLIGMFAISKAVRALFGVNLDDLTMETILPLGLAFLAPIYWLGTLPRYGEAEDVTELSFEARALSFLGTWMLAPLVIIYALIVLAYGAKILVQWDLPKGEIAQLVSPFIGVGMLVWLMLEPKVLKEGGFVRFYRAAWHWVMLPAAVLLGVAVFVRIGEYGFTVDRVFLVLVVVWAVVQSLWFTVLPKVKRDIRFPTALAAGLLMFGAFAAGPLSTMNQFQRAKAAKAQMASFERDVIENNPLQAKRFLSGLKYLIARQNERRFLSLLPNQKMPSSAYGNEYNALIKSLGLNGIDARHYTSGTKYNSSETRYSVVSKSGIPILADSKFYIGPSLGLYNPDASNSSRFQTSSQNWSEVVFLIEGAVYRIDFEAALSTLDIQGASKYNVPAGIAAIPVVSEGGVAATLLVLEGYLTYTDTVFNSGNITVAVIVPN